MGGGRNDSHGRWNVVVMFVWLWEGIGGRNDARGRCTLPSLLCGHRNSEGVQPQEGVGGRACCQVCVAIREWEGDVPYGILPLFLNEGKDSDKEGEEKPTVDVEPSAILAGIPHKCDAHPTRVCIIAIGCVDTGANEGGWWLKNKPHCQVWKATMIM